MAQRSVPLFAGLFFVGWLAVQVAMPLICMTAGVGCHYGWTMFAGRDVLWDYHLVTAGGETTSVPRSPEKLDSLTLLGKKVDEPRFVPERLCREHPEAVAVRVMNLRSGLEEVRPCRP